MSCCGDGAGSAHGSCGCSANEPDWGPQGFKIREDETFWVAAPSEFAAWKSSYGPECDCSRSEDCGEARGSAAPNQRVNQRVPDDRGMAPKEADAIGYNESNWERSVDALSVPVDYGWPPNEVVPWDPWLTTTTGNVTDSPPLPWSAVACGWCDGCWPLLTVELQIAAGMLPISVILDAEALLPISNPGPYQSTYGLPDTNPTYIESIGVTVLRDRSRNGACRAAGIDCQQEKPCRFDMDLSLKSHSASSFEVLGQPAPVVLAPGGAAIVVLKKEVACGSKLALGLKRIQPLPPGVVQLAQEPESDSLPIGRCEQCYPRC